MGKLTDWFDRLFEVKQKKQTTFSLLTMIILLLLIGNSLYFLMIYQKKSYEAYTVEYVAVKDAILKYEEENGTFPVSSTVNWSKEKNLVKFFEENGLSKGDQYYYVTLDKLSFDFKVKRTYILDITRGILYTREFEVYGLKRWHAPMAN